MIALGFMEILYSVLYFTDCPGWRPAIPVSLITPACDDCGVFVLMAGRRFTYGARVWRFSLHFGRGSGGVEGQHGRALSGNLRGIVAAWRRLSVTELLAWRNKKKAVSLSV